MQILTPGQAGEAERIHWLIRLRWVAVVGVCGVVVVSTLVLDLVPRPEPLWAISAAFLGWNLWLERRERRGRPPMSATGQVATDMVVLSSLLHFSGGLANPFAVFVVVQVILATMLLEPRHAQRMLALALGFVAVLVLLTYLGAAPPAPQGLPALPEWPRPAQWGSVIALAVTAFVAHLFCATIMASLRRRAREAQLSRQEVEREREKLREVVRTIGAGLVALGPDLRVAWCNRAARAILPEIVAERPFALDGLSWPPRGPLESGQVLVREWRQEREKGPSRLYEVSATPVRGDGQLLQVICVLRDISRQHATRTQLQQAEKLAALGRLSAGIAHEIATPLGSVDILAGEISAVLDEGLDAGTSREVRDYSRDIRREVDRISRLVRELLDLGHPAGGPKEEIDLGALVGEAAQLIGMRSKSARERIRCEIDPELRPIRLPKDRVLQVLINLLDNAVDATEPNQGAIVARASEEPEGDAVLLGVEDRGSGIAAEDRRRVFDPFFTTKDVGEGTGLGLYVSYEIVKQLGGDIQLESERGAGTRVQILIPRHLDVPTPESAS